MAAIEATSAARAQLSWAAIVKGQTSDSPDLSLDGNTAAVSLQSDGSCSEPSTAISSDAIFDSFTASSSQSEEALASANSESAATEECFSSSVNNSSEFLRPGRRGSLSCFCRGQVLSMLSHYGWLSTFFGIDHPLVMKHFGRIYVHKRDIVGGQNLKAGDIVSFYLYADKVGLGAEVCKVEEPVAASERSRLRPDAAEFVPGAGQASGPVSDIFARMSRAFDSIPANGPVQVAGINVDYFDDESSEDGDVGADADKESVLDESDFSSVESLDFVSLGGTRTGLHKVEVQNLVSRAPWRKGQSQDSTAYAGMTSDSTSAGRSSDSESETRSPPERTRLPSGLDARSFRPPPGLCPPPGLEGFMPAALL